jgi:hypothetical protein
LLRKITRVQEIDVADERKASDEEGASDSTPPEAVAGGSQWHPLTTAAMIGGAIAAAGAGAYLGRRALARKNCDRNGKLSPLMATAITATDLANRKGSDEPSAKEIKVDPAAE